MEYKICPLCQINVIESNHDVCDLCSGKYHKAQWELYWKNKREKKGLIRKHANTITKNDILSNDEIVEYFQCSNQGGMRKSNRTNSLVLIKDEQSVYEDDWKDEICYYTGMGLQGDQDFLDRQNRTLYYSRNSSIKIYLFERAYSGYRYIGRVELAASPYYERQKDRKGIERRVCIFPLKVIE